MIPIAGNLSFWTPQLELFVVGAGVAMVRAKMVVVKKLRVTKAGEGKEA